MLGIIPYLIMLIVIGLIIYGVVSWRKREQVTEVDPGIGTVRRLYFYTVSFVSLMMAVNGVILMLRFVLRGIFEGAAVSSNNAALASGVSLIIVGLPLWVFHWRLIQRYVTQLPVESRSLLRKLYMYLVLTVSGVATVVTAVMALNSMFGFRDFSAYVFSALLIWAVVWVFHWRIEEAEGQSTPDTLGIRRLYLYGGALVTLVMLASGLGDVIFMVIQDGYDALTSATTVISGNAGLWRKSFAMALSIGIIGGLVWGFYWLYLSRNDSGSALRQVYLYVGAVLGGVVTMLSALAIALNGVLLWLLGAADDSLATHFRFSPGVIATLAIGIGLWAYHWMVVQREARISSQEARDARRTYVYIVSGIGLVAVSIGAVILVGTALELVIDSFTQTISGRVGFRREPLALSITLLALGGPLWGYFWAAAQRMVREGGTTEPQSLPRRIFVFAALGAGALSLLGSGSTLLFRFLWDLLEGNLNSGTIDNLTIPVAIIVTAIIFVPYYWNVYKQDRQTAPEAEETPVVRKDVTVLVAPGGDDMVRRLQSALGYRVNSARWNDSDATIVSLSDEESNRLASQVASASGRRVMIIPGSSGIRVVSYE
jgi:hypothetical protein